MQNLNLLQSVVVARLTAAGYSLAEVADLSEEERQDLLAEVTLYRSLLRQELAGTALDQQLRGYLLLAWIGAALLWEKTAGRLLRKLICAIKTLVHWVLRGLIARLRRLRKGLERGCSAICGKLLGKINKKSKSRAKRPFLFPKNRVK